MRLFPVAGRYRLFHFSQKGSDSRASCSVDGHAPLILTGALFGLWRVCHFAWTLSGSCVNIPITSANPDRHIRSRNIWPERAARAFGTRQLYRCLDYASGKCPDLRFFCLFSPESAICRQNAAFNSKMPFLHVRKMEPPRIAQLGFCNFGAGSGCFSHLSRNWASRFSIKAAMPSFWSSVANSE